MNLSSRFDYHFLQINGTTQFVATTKKQTENKPCLFILHGGPGMALSHILDEVFVDLEDEYNLVIWDQRGAGLSYHNLLDSSSLTLHQLIEDTKSVSTWIKTYFEPAKLYLLGHSWGSTLGIYVVQKYPKFFNGFVSIGQWIIDEDAEIQSKKNIVTELAKNNLKINQNLESIITSVEQNNLWLDDILISHGYTITDTTTWNYQMDLIKNSRIYSETEKISYMEGMALSQHVYNDVIKNYNVTRDVRHIQIPSLFLVGENDWVTPKKLVYNFIDGLKSSEGVVPSFNILNNSRHYPFLEPGNVCSDKIKTFLNNI